MGISSSFIDVSDTILHPGRTRRSVYGPAYRPFTAHSNTDRTMLKIDPSMAVHRDKTSFLYNEISRHSLRRHITTVYRRQRVYFKQSTVCITVCGERSVHGPVLTDLGTLEDHLRRSLRHSYLEWILVDLGLRFPSKNRNHAFLSNPHRLSQVQKVSPYWSRIAYFPRILAKWPENWRGFISRRHIRPVA